MEQRYKFKNNGKPFQITIGKYSGADGISLYDGNLLVSDGDVISVELNCQKSTSGLIFKKTICTYSITVCYYFGGFRSKQKSSKTIAVASDEIETAKRACAEASQMIIHLKEKNEAYQRAQEEKIAKARKEDTIDAIDVNGNDIKIWRRETYFGDVVLFAEGGEVYHTHADCFENWKPMYRRNFKKWQLMEKKDAERRGLCECKLCEKYYEIENED